MPRAGINHDPLSQWAPFVILLSHRPMFRCTPSANIFMHMFAECPLNTSSPLLQTRVLRDGCAWHWILTREFTQNELKYFIWNTTFLHIKTHCLAHRQADYWLVSEQYLQQSITDLIVTHKHIYAPSSIVAVTGELSLESTASEHKLFEAVLPDFQSQHLPFWVEDPGSV